VVTDTKYPLDLKLRKNSDPTAGISITTISADSSGAWVQVTVGSQTCTRAKPTVTMTPGQSQLLTHEAQQRARTFDKIETATRALDCIDSALRIYPDETELNESRVAIERLVSLANMVAVAAAAPGDEPLATLADLS